MSEPAIVTKFDYSTLDAETRLTVRQEDKEFDANMEDAGSSFLKACRNIGRIHAALKYKRPGFDDWCKTKSGMSRRTAYKMLDVAKMCADSAHIQAINSREALYLLAKPSTPPEARDAAIEQAKAGKKLTHERAKQMVAETKDAARKAVQAYLDDKQFSAESQLRILNQIRLRKSFGSNHMRLIVPYGPGITYKTLEAAASAMAKEREAAGKVKLDKPAPARSGTVAQTVQAAQSQPSISPSPHLTALAKTIASTVPVTGSADEQPAIPSAATAETAPDVQDGAFARKPATPVAEVVTQKRRAPLPTVGGPVPRGKRQVFKGELPEAVTLSKAEQFKLFYCRHSVMDGSLTRKTYLVTGKLDNDYTAQALSGGNDLRVSPWQISGDEVGRDDAWFGRTEAEAMRIAAQRVNAERDRLIKQLEELRDKMAALDSADRNISLALGALNSQQVEAQDFVNKELAMQPA